MKKKNETCNKKHVIHFFANVYIQLSVVSTFYIHICTYIYIKCKRYMNIYGFIIAIYNLPYFII